MIRKAQIARIIITCSYSIMGLACIFIIVLPAFGVSMRLTTNFTDPGRPLPFQSYYVYDVTSRPQYELTFISQAIYIVLAMVTYAAIDNFLGLLVFHISGQLDILKNRLKNLDKYMNFHDLLITCVAKHNRLLRFHAFFMLYLSYYTGCSIFKVILMFILNDFKIHLGIDKDKIKIFKFIVTSWKNRMKWNGHNNYHACNCETRVYLRIQRPEKPLYTSRNKWSLF